MLASIFSLNVLQTALELGCIYGLVALALFLSYSILNIADLSTDGCFTLGCAVACQVALTGHPILALAAAMAAGVCSGFVTAFLQTRLGVESIMAGIIVNTGLYTINLAVMGFSSTMSRDVYKRQAHNAPDTHRPTVRVKAGLMLEARTMAALSPVARMESPSRVPRKPSIAAQAMAMITAASTSLYQLPRKPSEVFAMEKMVGVLTSDMVEEKPITARLMVYRPVLTMIPAMMLSTPSLVCKKAVTKPEHTPAAIAAADVYKRQTLLSA